jgi:NADPH2:quinone reductase
VQLARQLGAGTVIATAGSAAKSGRAVVFGASAGELGSVAVRELFGLKTVTGFSLLAWRAADPGQARADIASLTGWFGSGELRAVTGATLPLAEVSRAHRMLEERSVPGRLLLVP